MVSGHTAASASVWPFGRIRRTSLSAREFFRCISARSPTIRCPAEPKASIESVIKDRTTAVNAVVTRLYDQARAAITAGLPAGKLRRWSLFVLGVACAFALAASSSMSET